jgi:hypothetical protein
MNSNLNTCKNLSISFETTLLFYMQVENLVEEVIKFQDDYIEYDHLVVNALSTKMQANVHRE